MRRSGPIKRRTRLAPRNATRRTKEWARAYGSTQRVEWIAARPCSVCGCPRRPCENAHTVTGGTGRKADASTVIPLCSYHHAELHQVGAHTFEVQHRLPLRWTAEQTEEAWARSQSGLTHISDILPAALRGLTDRHEESA